jgi:hypothetical protein
MFGNSQVLGGLASFAAALINSLLSGLSMKAPFIVCVLCLVAVAVWTMRLADAPISTWIGNWLIKKTS